MLLQCLEVLLWQTSQQLFCNKNFIFNMPPRKQSFSQRLAFSRSQQSFRSRVALYHLIYGALRRSGLPREMIREILFNLFGVWSPQSLINKRRRFQ